MISPKKEKSKKIILKEKILNLQYEKDKKRGKLINTSDKEDIRNKLLKDNPLKFYKIFSKNPSEFQELYGSEQENISSSSSEEENSSDGFPSPESPKCNSFVKQLETRINILEKQLFELKLENKKLKIKLNLR